MKSSSKKSKRPQNKTSEKMLLQTGRASPITSPPLVDALRRQPQNSYYYFWGAVCLIAIAILTAYSNSFWGPFIYDDSSALNANTTITSLWPLGLFQSTAINLNPGALHIIHIRPITNWTFALNYALGGLEPVGYHVFNVLMHLSSSLLVFGVIRRTLLSKPLKERWGNHALLLSLAIALLWAVHPLQTNAIDYITQRLESLAGFFYLATLYCLIRGSDTKNAARWLSIGVLTAFLGMGSKETMVTAPAVLLLYDRAFLVGSFKGALAKRSWFYFGLVLAWVFLAILLINGHTGSIGTSERGATSDTWSYAATQLSVVLHYLKLTVWPSPLILDNYWPVANTLNVILWPGLVVAAMAGLTLWGFIKNRPWAFIGLWFFIILSPSSSFVPIMDEYVNEYRMYLPVLAPITLLVMGLYAGLQQAMGKLRLVKEGGRSNPATILVFTLITAAAVIAFGITTYERNKDYASDISIWSDNVLKTPNNPRAHGNLGSALGNNGSLGAAIEEFKKEIAMVPGSFKAHGNLALALLRAHQTEAANIEFQKVIAVDQNNVDAHNGLGVIFSQQGNLKSAVEQFRMAYSARPDDQHIKDNLQNSLSDRAKELYVSGNKAGAIERLQEVLVINPNNLNASKNLFMLTGK